MTEEEIILTIAEHQGWKKVGHHWISPKSGFAYLQCELKMFAGDYCKDLNVMHAVEETITGLDWEKYYNGLVANGKASGVRATARQRAEQYIKTYGLWKE